MQVTNVNGASGPSFRANSTAPLSDTDLASIVSKLAASDPAAALALRSVITSGMDPVRAGRFEAATTIRFEGAPTVSRSDSTTDRDGGTIFIGGAGTQGDYLRDMERAFTEAGIADVEITAMPQAADRQYRDLLTVPTVNDTTFAGALSRSPRGQALIGIMVERSEGAQHAGEQLNLGGYSYGAATSAALALASARAGAKIDNVILVGAPINRDLLNALRGHPNIGNVIEVDLGVHGDPIHAGMTDGELARTMPTLAGQIENAEGHFHYSAPGAEGAARRDELAERLTDAGVR